MWKYVIVFSMMTLVTPTQKELVQNPFDLGLRTKQNEVVTFDATRAHKIMRTLVWMRSTQRWSSGNKFLKSLNSKHGYLLSYEIDSVYYDCTMDDILLDYIERKEIK